MTKIIYINWDTHEIVHNAKEKEQWIDGWVEANDLIYDFDEWLISYYDIIEVYHMTTEEKAELPTRYEEYRKHTKELHCENAEREFDKWFEEIGIEVNGYAD